MNGNSLFLSGNLTYTRIDEFHRHIFLLPLVCWTTDPIKYILFLKYDIFPTDCFSFKLFVFLILALKIFSFYFIYIIYNAIIYQSFNPPTLLIRVRKYTTTWAAWLKFRWFFSSSGTKYLMFLFFLIKTDRCHMGETLLHRPKIK